MFNRETSWTKNVNNDFVLEDDGDTSRSRDRAEFEKNISNATILTLVEL